MRHIPNYLFFLLILAALAGCKKHDDDLTLVNNTARRIYFNMYGSDRDYSLGQNCLVSGYVESKKKLIIPRSKVITYGSYIDWYSEDFLYTNWMIPHYGLSWKKNIGTIEDVPLSYARKICLSNGPSRWKLVDAVGAFGSSFDSLSAYEKSLEIVINKRSVEFYHTDSYGNAHEWTSREIIADGFWFDISLDNTTGFNLNSAIPPAPSSHTKDGADTLVYVTSNMNYVMVKEK
ncbi:MAG: hypothetical protein JSS82_04105 [Bacteroidetes bacterium]|nr:hypothetical protein [Bacteroidota bacterium]